MASPNQKDWCAYQLGGLSPFELRLDKYSNKCRYRIHNIIEDAYNTKAILDKSKGNPQYFHLKIQIAHPMAPKGQPDTFILISHSLTQVEIKLDFNIVSFMKTRL